MPIPPPRIFNVVPDRPDARDFRVSAPPPRLTALPPRVDLWEQGIVPEIWNQQSLGSCTGHGGGRALEIERRRQGYTPRTPSRLFLYYVEREIEGTIGEDAGAQIRTCIKAMAQLGVPEEELWPYDIREWQKKPIQAAYDDALTHQLTRYTRLTSVEQICASVAAGKPVVFGFTVFESFQSPFTATTGVVRLPDRTEKQLGGHCMCFTGYEITCARTNRWGPLGRLFRWAFNQPSSEGYLIADNSWGADWGMQGRCKMPFEFVTQNAWDFWTVEAVEG